MTRRGLDFNELRTNNNDKPPSIADQVDLFKFPPDKFVTIRIVSPVYMYAGYWVKSKKKDGSPVKFYMPSPSYNPETQSFDSTIYDPFYEIAQGERSVEDREARLVQVSTYGYCCAIIQQEERNRPSRLARPTESERASGFKEKDSDTWTPVKVLRLSSTVLEQIAGIMQTNIIRTKQGEKAVSIAHPKFGLLLRVKHSPKKSPSSQYQVIPGDRAPLTEQQAKYLTWDLSALETPEPEDRIKSNFERWSKSMGLEDASDSEDDFDDEAPRRAKRKQREEPEDDWDADDSGDGFDDEEDLPKAKAKSSKNSPKRRPEPEPEEEDDEDDWGDEDEDEDEDEAPPKRRPASKGKAPVGKPKRRPEPEPDDEDEDDWGDESDDDWSDEEEEPPAKKSKPKRRPEPEPDDAGEDDWSDDEDESDDDSWDDEDEEEAPPPKRRPAPKGKAPVAKPKRRRPDPEEDLEDDDIPF